MRGWRVGRDGLRFAREARGARRGDPRCHLRFARASFSARACSSVPATSRSRSRRSRALSGHHRQDHHRAEGRSSTVGPAVGDRGGQSLAHDAEECGNSSPLGIKCSSCRAQSSIGDSAPRIGSLSARPRLGGSVRKGERGTTVLYADHFVPDEERRRAVCDGGEPVVAQAETLIAATGADFRIDRRRELKEPPSANRRRGRPRFEGGRCRRDGSHAARSRSAQPVTENNDAHIRRSGSRRLRR